MQPRLLRSRRDRMIAGVCGGLGAYLGIDATLVRLAFLLVAFFHGAGALLYLVLWLIVPQEGEEAATGAEAMRQGAREMAEQARRLGDELGRMGRASTGQARLLVGGGLVAVGVLLLLENLDIPWLRWATFDRLWPMLLIVAGILLLRSRGNGGQ